MIELTLDPSRSQIRLRTFAEGLFSKIAHDLELVCSKLSGTASRDDTSAAMTGTATIEIPIRGIEVAGTLHGSRVDAAGLSTRERHDCLEKMRREVFHVGDEGVVRAEIVLRDTAAHVRIVPPKGKSAEMSARVTVREQEGVIVGQGMLEVSLSAIGSDVVKGPMNAFRVKDRVEVHFEIAFTPK
ncbi:MAG: hypothetical protein FWD69_13070 [Polyangiaceae bacterium]|nr:hypothetical protein [Polyangiaceae bacterium]